MSSSIYKAPKEQRKAKRQEEEYQERELSPHEKRRQTVIHVGVWVLVLAFMMTSGIVCVNFEDELPPPPSQNQSSSNEDEAALEKWQERVGENPEDAAGWANVGFYQTRLASRLDPEKEAPEREKQLALAEENLRKALEVDPNYFFAYEQLGRTLIVGGKTEQARETFEQAYELAEQEPADESEEAEKKAQKVTALMGLSELDFREEDFQGAIGQLDRVIEVKPGEGEAYVRRAAIYHQLEEKDKARADLLVALDIAQNTQDQELLMISQGLLQQLMPEEESGEASSGEEAPGEEKPPGEEEPPADEAQP